MSEQKFEFLPLACDNDVIEGYGYAGLLIGHGCESWLVRALSAYTRGAEAELARRGLLKEAQRNKRVLWKVHHARKEGGKAWVKRATSKASVGGGKPSLAPGVAPPGNGDFQRGAQPRLGVVVRGGCAPGAEPLAEPRPAVGEAGRRRWRGWRRRWRWWRVGDAAPGGGVVQVADSLGGAGRVVVPGCVMAHPGARVKNAGGGAGLIIGPIPVPPPTSIVPRTPAVLLLCSVFREGHVSSSASTLVTCPGLNVCGSRPTAVS